ncbi:hypothetical protein [Paraburkholderia sediminicola]|uniref:hypothetical protein n=1 Tax=Paraburkholderia sediminicola TaxID=458836 RepID=UPI0038BB4EF9
MLREEAVIVFDGNCSHTDQAFEALESTVVSHFANRAQIRQVSGGVRPISECLARYEKSLSLLRNYNAPLSAIIYNAGDHDLPKGVNANAAYQSLAKYVALAHEQGWKVVITTRFQSLRYAGNLQSEAQKYQQILHDNAAGADAVIDLDLDLEPDVMLSASKQSTAYAESETVADLVVTAISELWQARPVREKLVLFGEVQILAIYRHLLSVLQEAQSERFSLEFVDSNDDHAVEAATNLLADSGTLILQINPERPFLHEKVAKITNDMKGRSVFSVPMLLCRSLWPFDQPEDNTDAVASSPIRGTRGDSSLLELIKQSSSPELAVPEYLSIDLSQKVDLTQLFQADLSSWQSVENLSSVKFRSFFEEQFPLKKLFNSFKLPSNFSIKVIVDAICHFLEFSATEIEISNKRLKGAEILQPDTPIHPSIGRHFNLQWLKRKPLFDIFGRKFDYPRWASEYANIYAVLDKPLISMNMASPGSSIELDSPTTSELPLTEGRMTGAPDLNFGPAARESQKPSPRPKRWEIWQKAKQANKLFVFCVALPVLLSTAYYTVFAADVYVSQSSFVVRSPQKTTQSVGLVSALLQGSGLSRSTDDTYAVNDYIVSRDALAALNKNDAFANAYGSEHGDFLSRFGNFPQQRTFEDLLRYFRRRVLVQYDTETGITTLEVHAFTAADAQTINQHLLELGEQRVNRMNDRAKQDLISYARQEVERAEINLQKSTAALSSFRDKQSIFDPERQSTLALQNVLQIQKDLVSSKLLLAQLKSISPDNPQIPSLNVRISTLQNEIDKASNAVTGGRDSLAFKSPAYERLELDRQFADRQLTTALASLETARADAQRQQLYLEHISQPNLPDKPMLPYRIRNIMATLILGLVIWGTLNLLIASIREHRD